MVLYNGIMLNNDAVLYNGMAFNNGAAFYNGVALENGAKSRKQRSESRDFNQKQSAIK